ncbi:uncharacterized protein LOC142153022 [Mixophyes fleayi]|uniref:uncharacterized protein LOC142153022 n=1 Tax=Mixophyes fleayi TaxID=3061075 RepID=UPI003F4D7D46
MTSQVQKRSVVFVLFFLWASVLTGTCLTPDQIKRATDHIRNTITKQIDQQYAYVVKFSEDQCKELNGNDIDKALKQDVEKASEIRNNVTNSKIYIGTNLVMASYKDIKKNRRNTIRRHAERRLLTSEDSGPVPVSSLLDSKPEAGCAIFYTLYSPCTKACANLEVDYNIIDKFYLFESVKDTSFVFGSVYFTEKKKEEVWLSFERINKKMPLYRCSNANCMKCFEKQNNGLEARNENCFFYNT